MSELMRDHAPIRRRRRTAIRAVSGLALIGVVVVATVVLTRSGVMEGAGRVAGYVSWGLKSVSADARTLEIEYDVPECDSKQGRIVVKQDARSVNISIPRIRVVWSGDCPAMAVLGRYRVHLDTPLGRRTLTQPGGRSHEPHDDAELERALSPSTCMPFKQLPLSAPARDVPWVASRVRVCTAPLPKAVRRLPILRGARSHRDRLPYVVAKAVAQGHWLLRPGLSRRLEPAAGTWLVPGPYTTCFGHDPGHGRIGSCQPTSRVAARGAWTMINCSNRATPRRASLVGIVPAGIHRVLLEPAHGRARSAEVRDGVWVATAPYPLVIRYGTTRFRTTYETRAC